MGPAPVLSCPAADSPDPLTPHLNSDLYQLWPHRFARRRPHVTASVTNRGLPEQHCEDAMSATYEVRQ